MFSGAGLPHAQRRACPNGELSPMCGQEAPSILRTDYSRQYSCTQVRTGTPPMDAAVSNLFGELDHLAEAHQWGL